MKTIWLLVVSFWVVPSLFAQHKPIILDHKDRIRTTPLSALNSRYRETNLSITPDGKYLYFMSVRGQRPWSNQFMTYKGEPVYDGDIWYSKKVKGVWQKPDCLPWGINTASGEDEPNISPDGRTVTFQSWKTIWQFDDGPYYTTTLSGDNWGKPVGLGGGISQFFIESGLHATDGMTVSPDGKTFIVACGNDYDGKMDLYISRKNKSGWSYLKKMGISTSANERSAFIAGDGKTLYFASDGYGGGFGGLDIYKVEMRTDGTFSDPINIGAPFNTAKDDYGFILTGDGNEAYFVRDGDIYFADLTKADDRIKPKVEILVTGTIKDKANKRGVAASISLLDIQSQKVVQKIKAKNNGTYSFVLPNEDKTYELLVSADGYIEDNKKLKTEKTPFEHSYQSNFTLSKEIKEPIAPPVKPAPARPEPPIVIVEPKPILPPEPPKPVYSDYPIAEIQRKEAPQIVFETNTTNPYNGDKIIQDPYSFEGVAENHLVLMLDVSGSMMNRDKLPLLKQSFLDLITHMRKEDKVTIISYAKDANVLVENVSVKEIGQITNALQKLRAEGKTQSVGAMKKAIKMGKKHYIQGGNNRIILATDSDFDITDLYSSAKKASANQLFLSVFGFGKMSKDKESNFNTLANKGNGNFYQVNSENISESLLMETKAIRKLNY